MYIKEVNNAGTVVSGLAMSHPIDQYRYSSPPCQHQQPPPQQQRRQRVTFDRITRSSSSSTAVRYLR